MKLQIKYDVGSKVFAMWGNRISPAEVKSIMVEAWAEDDKKISYGLELENGEYQNFDAGEVFETRGELLVYIIRELNEE